MDPQLLGKFWSLPAPKVLEQLETTPQGLSEDEAKARLGVYGANSLSPRGTPAP